MNLSTRITLMQHAFALATTARLRRFGLGIACGLMLAGLATAQPTLINTTLPNAVHGEPYAANLMLGGDPVPTSVTVTGLPTGLTATHNGSGSVAITGSTTQVGTFTATITATNSGGTITPTVPLTVARFSKLATAIAAGRFHSCAVVNGGVLCWGANTSGQLGNGSFTKSTIPVQAIPTGSGATAVATGESHSCAVVGGGVQCWGVNSKGQLGQNVAFSAVPIQTIAANGNVTAVAAGARHTCAVVSGGLKCWGDNAFGQLGNGSTQASAIPQQTIAANSGVTLVAAGPAHSCAVVNAGVQCWGGNDQGQVGNNSVSATLLAPVQAIASSSGAAAIAAGSAHTCAAVNAGVQCWGANDNGQLGNNGTALSRSPVQTIVANSNVTTVAAGNDSSCAVVGGGAQCWGIVTNEENAGVFQVSRAPLQTIAAGVGVTALAIGESHSCAIVGGGVVCWRVNDVGQLGNIDSETTPVPVQAISAGSGVTAIAAGYAHSCAVVSGGVQCWGRNSYGQLGNNSRVDSSVPVQAINPGSGATAVAAGSLHSCAVVNGATRCWGFNGNGQLGNNSTVDSLVPVATTVIGGGSVDAVTAGSFHSCALLVGGVKCWGKGSSGQLGNNSTLDSTVPVQAIAVFSNAYAVSGGGSHNCAVVLGSLRCWGYNFYGQVGNNSTADSLVPVPVAATANSFYLRVAAGGGHSCAGGRSNSIPYTNLGVRCWGHNYFGELGNNSTANSLVPVQAIVEGSDVTNVTAGSDHTCAVVSGGVQCWGRNYDGQLGINSIVNSPVPAQAIPSGSNVTALAAGYAHTCALINGGVQCWGHNGSGRLADPGAAPGHRVFAAIPFGDFVLTVNKSGTGAGGVSSASPGVACGATCAATYAAGSAVTLTATPSAGSIFSGWSGGGCTGTGTCTVVLNAATTVVPTFTLNTYAVSTSIGANGGGSLACTPNPVPHGSTTTCVPTPSSGFAFASWSGDCTGGGACSLANVTATKSVTAFFNATQTITNFAPPAFYLFGAAPITLTATGGGSSSPVLFATTGAASICTVSGNVATVTGAGTCALTADQAEAAGYLAAAQVTANIVILKASPTLALAGNGSSAFGSSVPFTALLSAAVAAAGNVQFFADTVAISGCSARPVASNAATCATTALAAGARSITAVYSGDSNHHNATAPAVTHTVTGVAANLTFAPQVPNVQALVIGGTFAVNPLAVAGASSAPVAYSVAPVATCSISGTTIIMNGLGSCAITVNQAADGSNPAATPVTQTVTIVATLDVDRSVSSTKYHAHTDGILIVRYLSGMTGAALNQGALGSSATRTDSVAIKAHLDAIRAKLDIDGDGSFDPKTDGLLVLRYLLGLRGTALTANALAIAPQVPTRTLPADIEAYLQGLMP